MGRQTAEQAVRDATNGLELYGDFAGDGDPLAEAIRKTLQALEASGQNRCLLTYILVMTSADSGLRQEMFEVFDCLCEQQAKIGEKAALLRDALAQLMPVPLAPAMLVQLQPKREKFVFIQKRIIAMDAFKSLHECLHGLQAKLMHEDGLVDAAPDPPEIVLANIQANIRDVCERSERIIASLAAQASDLQDDLRWISDFAKLGADLKFCDKARIVWTSGTDAMEVSRLVRQRLIALSQQIFSVSQLPLDPLLAIHLDPQHKQMADTLEFRLLDLKSSVLWHAFKHKLWQEMERELAAIGDVLAVSALGFGDDWFDVKSELLWLTSLDAEEEWARQTRQCVEPQARDIDDLLAHVIEMPDDAAAPDLLRSKFDELHRLISRTFLAVDAAFKADCQSLRNINPALDPVGRHLNNCMVAPGRA